MKRIPLRAQDGTVRAFALVDDEDYEVLNRHAWHLGTDGYARRTFKVDGRSRLLIMHRTILGLERGDGYDTDHVNGNRLDNRRANLRRCTRSENMQNLRQTRARSGQRHVYWHAPSGLWHVQLQKGGQFISGGYFKRVEDAATKARELRALHLPFSQEVAA